MPNTRRRPPGAARQAANAGAAGQPGARITTGAQVGPQTAAVNPGNPGTTRQPHQRRSHVWIVVLALAGIAAVVLMGLLMRSNVVVNVNNGGSKVVVVNPDSPNSGQTAIPSPSTSTKPTATPSPSATASASDTPTPSSTMPEDNYHHWISPANFTTACHQQASPESSAVFQPELYNAGLSPGQMTYCQHVTGQTSVSWYSAATSQPLGPVISYSVNLDLYCQYTYGQAGDGQWKAENGSNNQYANAPPAQGANPFPHEMCYKVPATQ